MRCLHGEWRFFLVLLCLAFALPALAQPIGDEITLIDETPIFSDAGLEAYTPDGPVVLGQTNGEDREPKISILANGTTSVFWVNRNGSHHVNGIDASGALVFPTITEDNAPDIIVGPNTGANTNWTLDKANAAGTLFMGAATWQAGSLSGTDAVIPDTVVDEWGIHEDDGQGHGFFKLFNDQLEPVTPDPISISQISAGHREWDCCWLSNGKLVIGTVARDHPYAGDPDFSEGGVRVGWLNIFNDDGTRYKDEFYAVEDMTGEQADIRLGGLANGFVMMYNDNKSAIGGPSMHKGVIFDNEGNKVKDFIVKDEDTGIDAAWMDAGGGSTFVTVQITSGLTVEMGAPEELAGMNTVTARLWDSDGEPITPFIIVSQAWDGRSYGRERCAMAPNGSFVVTWHDGGADYLDGTESAVARVFNADGTPATDAFLVHPIPEFTDEAGNGYNGDAGEVMPAITNDRVSVTWGSRAVPGGEARDVVVMSFKNPAADTTVDHWSLFD